MTRPPRRIGTAHQGVIDFLAGFRPEGEKGVVLRVGQVERPGVGGDIADQPLADAQAGLVHRRRLQSLGGEQFQDLAGALHVDRAHLGHHVGGDDDDDLIQAYLGGAGARHDVAHPRQQASRRR